MAASLSPIFELILENHPDMILVKREKSKLVWANKAFRQLYGMTNQQLRDLVDSPVNEPDYTEQYVIDDKWVWDHGRPLTIQCEPVVRHDGVVRKLRTMKFPVFDESGKVMLTVGVSKDITAEIEKDVIIEATAKMASLGEMAGGIAHEINNPIGVICAKARQIRQAFERNGEVSQEKLHDSLTAIESYAQRVARIVNGLQAFSRDGSRDAFQNESLAKIFNETYALCQSKLVNLGITMSAEIDPEIILKCRPVQISQVLLNLISNAIDAVALSSAKSIWLEASRDSLNAFISIWDSGAGVPDDVATKVMQPFFTTKESGKGTGLGLSISHSIVSDHGGSLRLDRGKSLSCFKITLPLAI